MSSTRTTVATPTTAASSRAGQMYVDVVLHNQQDATETPMDDRDDLTPSATYTLCVASHLASSGARRALDALRRAVFSRDKGDRRNQLVEEDSTVDDWLDPGDWIHVLDIIDPLGCRRNCHRRPRRRPRLPRRRSPPSPPATPELHGHPAAATCAGHEDNRYRWSSSSDAYNACLDAGCSTWPACR